MRGRRGGRHGSRSSSSVRGLRERSQRASLPATERKRTVDGEVAEDAGDCALAETAFRAGRLGRLDARAAACAGPLLLCVASARQPYRTLCSESEAIAPIVAVLPNPFIS